MSQPIRVTHVALQLATGGMEKLLVEFARHADSRRFQLRFIVLGARGPVAPEIEACGWEVCAMDAPPGLQPSLVWRLAQRLRQGRSDIVHTHNTRPLLYAGPAARLAGAVAVVHTRHGQRHGATRRQNALFRLAGRCADRVVCVSENSANLSAAEGIRSQSLRTIHNGIDVSRFSYTGPRPHGPAVLVGRLTPEKDVATLLRAVAEIKHARPSFRLQIAGTGPQSDDLKSLARGLSLENHVEFLGEVQDVPALLARASLFVLSSLTEGIALTILEAMARGLPVVATRVGGNPEVVVNEVTGLLVSAADPGQLAHALLRVHSDPILARRMGEAGRRRVEQQFDVRNMVAQYQSLYLEVLRTRKRLAA
jgi:glycosyltransferase involved in cell wall biosynthesis